MVACVVATAIAASSGAVSAASPYGATGGGSFIVASKVISDTVAAPKASTPGGLVSYVGDIGGSVVADSYPVMETGAGCASGNCGNASGGCESGGCASGDCGSSSCESGDCGGECNSGTCGGKAKLGGLISKLGKGFGSVGDIDVGCQSRKYDTPDLFYNFFSQGNCNATNAQMYISPGPVPHFVGHTFNTYQPFYPHEYMYWHKNRYNNTYDNGRGLNRTKALYYAPPVRTAISNIYWNKLRLPR